MPIYEYHCDRCDEVFEVKQRISEDPLREHPGCGGPVERLISATSFRLKGTGWYQTDYAGRGKKKAEKTEKSGGETGGGAKSTGDGAGSSGKEGGKPSSGTSGETASKAS